MLPVGSSLRVRNIDHEAHTVHGALAGRTLFNRATVPGGNEALLPLDAPGVVAITCDLHSYMRAWVIVSNTPHHAVTGTDGTFRITGLPSGPAKVRLIDPELRHAPDTVAAAITLTDQNQTLELVAPERPETEAEPALTAADRSPNARGRSWSWARMSARRPSSC